MALNQNTIVLRSGHGTPTTIVLRPINLAVSTLTKIRMSAGLSPDDNIALRIVPFTVSAATPTELNFEEDLVLRETAPQLTKSITISERLAYREQDDLAGTKTRTESLAYRETNGQAVTENPSERVSYREIDGLAVTKTRSELIASREAEGLLGTKNRSEILFYDEEVTVEIFGAGSLSVEERITLREAESLLVTRTKTERLPYREEVIVNLTLGEEEDSAPLPILSYKKKKRHFDTDDEEVFQLLAPFLTPKIALLLSMALEEELEDV